MASPRSCGASILVPSNRQHPIATPLGCLHQGLTPTNMAWDRELVTDVAMTGTSSYGFSSQ